MFWLLLLFPFFLCAKPLEVQVSSESAILMNAKTGAILYEKAAHQPRHPASLTKVGTALFLLEGVKVDPSHVVEASREALRHHSDRGKAAPYLLDRAGSMMGLKIGEIITVESLLHGMLISSGNDAANVLAEAIGGSIPAFVDQMNQFLRGIGCLNTRFFNPHGLHLEEHQTTAYDLALMTKRALQFPLFREIVIKSRWEKPGGYKQDKKELVQTNHLVRSGKFYDPRVIGVKTGYTSEAGYSLVAAAESGGRTLIAVLLGAQKRNDRYYDAKKLFDAAFKEESIERLLFSPTQQFRREVEGADDMLVAQLQSAIQISYFPAEEPTIRAEAVWQLPSLPIRPGTKVGEVRILSQEGHVIASQPLLAQNNLRATWSHKLQRWLRMAW